MKNPSTSFSLRQPLGLGPGRHVGQRRRAAGRGAGGLAEQRRLARLPLLLQQLRLAEHRVERLDQLLAVAAQGVAGAGGDQRLEHPLVAEPEVDPLDEVGQRRVNGASCARRR